MREFCLSLLFVVFGATAVSATTGYSISVELSSFEGEEIYLAYYQGPSQYLRDTAERIDGRFVFTGEEPLQSGFYLVVLPPDNRFFQILVDEVEQDIQIKADANDLQAKIEVQGSQETSRFYNYAEFLGKRRPMADSLRKALADGATDAQADLDALNDDVQRYKNQFLTAHPKSLAAMLINASEPIDIPEFSGSDAEIQMQTYRHYRDHYFDKIPLRDERILRTPFLHERIDYYINKLTYQQPDSISASIDYILSHFDPEGDAFQVYLVHFLNSYAKSKIVGMDAVYVHLVDEYYAQGKAPWAEEEQVRKIIKNARTLSPILIGKVAPDIVLQSRDKQPLSLHAVNADYTVLFFWDPDCGHCKKSLPDLQAFYDTYASKGVEVFAVCTKLNDDAKCWETIDERAMGRWLNGADPFLRSRFKQIYDVRTTPQIFVLNKEKEIVMKRIGADQLAEVLDHLLADSSQ